MANAGNLTTTTALSPMMKELYDKQLIFREKQELRFEQVAWVKEVPSHEGKTANFQAYRPLAVPSTKLTEGSDSSHTDYSMNSRRVPVTVESWGATTTLGKLFHMTKIDPGLVEQVDIVADQRNRTIDQQLAIEVGQNGVFPVRGDASASYQEFNLRVSSAGHSTSKLVVLPADDTASASNLTAGAIVCITAGNNYGYTGRVSRISAIASGLEIYFKSSGVNRHAQVAFDSDTRFTTFDQATLAAATSKLSTTNIRAGRKHLRLNRAPYFDGGSWVAIVDPNTEYDFMGDTTWVNAGQYSNVTALYKGEMGMWMNVRFVGTTAPYRETAAGATDMTAGGLFHSMIFGRKAFAHAKLQSATEGIVVLQGADKKDPLNMHTVIGWKNTFKPRALTAPHCVSIIGGATGVTIA